MLFSKYNIKKKVMLKIQTILQKNLQTANVMSDYL